jgi:plastocyanin
MTRPLAVVLAPLLLASFAPGPMDVPGTARMSGRAVSEAVVWLEADKSAPPVKHPRPVLDQRNISFLPHVLAVQVGTKVEFPNHDRVFHNVFSDHDGKVFDLGLYPVGMVKQIDFDRAGLSRVFCNIHPQMSAYVMVLDTPYFAVADAEGKFNIREVMPGDYHYHAWRAGGQILNGTVKVAPGVAMEVRW